jgi:hypothetical protein
VVTTNDAAVWLRLPDGSNGRAGTLALDRALARWLGAEVSLVSVVDEPSLHQEMSVDNEDESSDLIRWRTPRGRYVDLYPLHLLTTRSLGDLDVRRFRPNLVLDLDEIDEASLLGRHIVVGEVELSIPDQRTERCVMITRSQPGVPADRSLLRRLARLRGVADGERLTAGSGLAVLGCYGAVVTTGTIRVGTEVRLVD